MFENYPKTRPQLPKDIQEIYSVHYKSNRQGGTTASSLSQRLESWLHRQVARDVASYKEHSSKVTLELGAGTLNQLNFEPMCLHYDIVEPFEELYRDSPFLKNIRRVYSDISEVPLVAAYDRITSVATLEHICNLPEVVAQSGLLLKDGGVFKAAIPNEGSLLWFLGWKCTTGLEFKLKHGLDYGLLMKHEHVNTAYEIEKVLESFFERIVCKVFGISKSLALYRYYECYSPIVDKCRKYLKIVHSNSGMNNINITS